MGSLAYIGNSAVFDLNNFSFAGGLIAMYLWRSVYWSEQVSYRTRVLLMLDWIKRGIWGRDLSKVSFDFDFSFSTSRIQMNTSLIMSALS